MAAYSVSGGEYDSTGSGERECGEWSGDDGDGVGVVWVYVFYCGDDWVVDYDFEY